MSELQVIQKAVGALMPEVRKSLGDYLPPMEASFPIAYELFLVAFAMVPKHRDGALRIAGMYCQISGLNPDEVEAFALAQIRDTADQQAA
jgi:hypothetical protein